MQNIKDKIVPTFTKFYSYIPRPNMNKLIKEGEYVLQEKKGVFIYQSKTTYHVINHMNNATVIWLLHLEYDGHNTSLTKISFEFGRPNCYIIINIKDREVCLSDGRGFILFVDSNNIYGFLVDKNMVFIRCVFAYYWDNVQANMKLEIMTDQTSEFFYSLTPNGLFVQDKFMVPINTIICNINHHYHKFDWQPLFIALISQCSEKYRSVISTIKDHKIKNSSDEDKKDDQTLCAVCMTNPRNMLLIKCSHLCLCSSCINKLSINIDKVIVCPICREKCDSWKEVIIS